MGSPVSLANKDDADSIFIIVIGGEFDSRSGLKCSRQHSRLHRNRIASH